MPARNVQARLEETAQALVDLALDRAEQREKWILWEGLGRDARSAPA